MFERVFLRKLDLEGGYSDDACDAGRPTLHGVSSVYWPEWFARVAAAVDMPARVEVLKEFYRTNFWDVMRLDGVAEEDEELVFQVFDMGVNAGVGDAVRMLQRCLNWLGSRPELVVDGRIGPKTLAAVAVNWGPGHVAGLIGWISEIMCFPPIRMTAKKHGEDTYAK